MQTRVKDKSSSDGVLFWLFYFLFTIVLFGIFVGFLMMVPLYLIGRFFKPAQDLADSIFCRGVEVLMDVQPWLNLKCDVRLPQSLPSKGVLLVSNHRSHLDAFILLSRVKGIRILARSSLFRVPFLGFFMRMTRQIASKRGEIASFVNALEIVKDRLKNGETVHIFPELTRCEKGYVGTQDFSALPFHVAIVEKATLVPIVFFGTDYAWPKGQLGLSFRYPVHVVSLPAIDCAQFSTSAQLRLHVKQLMDAELSRGPP